MKYFIIFVLAVLVICVSFMWINRYNKLNEEIKIVISYSKYYAGTEPYILKR